jgi:hypothetical protein
MTALALAMVLAASTAAAPTVRLEPDPATPGVVTVTTGFERALLPLSVGVALGLEAAKRPLALGVELTMPLLQPDVEDLRGRVWATLDLDTDFGWLVRPCFGVYGITTTNDAFTASGLGAQLGGLAGFSSQRWLVGAELVGNVTIVEYLTTTPYARRMGSPTTGVTLWGAAYGFQAGVRAGVLLGPIELSVRAGFDRKGKYNLAIPPAYATASLGVRWGGAR